MTRSIVFHPDARQDVRLATAWYEREWPGAYTGFIAELERLLQRIEHFPEAHQIVRGDYRRASLKRFPYTVVFRARCDELLIVAVYHQHRNPCHLDERVR